MWRKPTCWLGAGGEGHHSLCDRLTRQAVVLETKATAEKKAGAPAGEPPPAGTLWHDSKKPRPRALLARPTTWNALGKAFITVNENGGDQPSRYSLTRPRRALETAARLGSDLRAHDLVHPAHRLAGGIPLNRLREVVRQLSGIGGGRSLGFGPNRVRSLPDGVGPGDRNVPAREGRCERQPAEGKVPATAGICWKRKLKPTAQHTLKIGDLCPECGEAAVVNEEGCRKCYACGLVSVRISAPPSHPQIPSNLGWCGLGV